MTRFAASLRRLAAVAIVLGLSACTAYSLVPPMANDVANFRVEPDIAWNKANKLRVDSSAALASWTADGPGLNNVIFIGGVKDGTPVLTVQGDTGGTKDALVFRKDMSPSEIVELWEAAITKLNQTSIAKASNIQPTQFGGMPGFKFEFSYTNKDEVERSGLGYAAVKDGRLYMIFYSGTKLHHYGLRLASAQKMMETAQIRG